MKKLKSFILSVIQVAMASIVAGGIVTTKCVLNASTAAGKRCFLAIKAIVRDTSFAISQRCRQAKTKMCAWLHAMVPYCFVLAVFIVGTFAPLAMFDAIKLALQTTGKMVQESFAWRFFTGEAFVFVATLLSLICGDGLCNKLCKKEEHKRAKNICEFVVFFVGIVYSGGRYGLQMLGVSDAEITLFAAHAAAFTLFRQRTQIWNLAKNAFSTPPKQLKGE